MRFGGSFAGFETEFAIQCHVCKSEGGHVMPLLTSFPLSLTIHLIAYLYERRETIDQERTLK
jgi:hypothetical protein